MNKYIIILFLMPSLLLSQNNCKIVGGEEFNINAEICGLESHRIDTLVLNEENLYRYSWTGKKETLLECKLITTNYPKEFINSDSSFQLIEGFLNSTISSVIENKDYEYLNSGLEFIKGYPGKNFKFKNLTSNKLFEFKCYLVKNQLIELITISDSSNWFSKMKSNFFESLKLINRIPNEQDYGIPIIRSDTYAINFPQTPELMNLYTDSDKGLVNMRTKIYESKKEIGNVIFMSCEAKYETDFKVEKEALDLFYNDSMNGSINSMNGKFLSKKEITYKENKGIEYYSSLNSGAMIATFRIFWIDGTFYTFGVLHSEKEMNSEGKDYMNSFKIKN